MYPYGIAKAQMAVSTVKPLLISVVALSTVVVGALPHGFNGGHRLHKLRLGVTLGPTLIAHMGIDNPNLVVSEL